MSLHEIAVAAAELVDAIGDRAARDQASWEDGYRYAARVFFDLGFETGCRTTADVIAEAQRRANLDLINEAAELDRLNRARSAPCGDAYFAAVARHSGTEFGGVGRPRVPAPADAARIALARARSRGERAA